MILFFSAIICSALLLTACAGKNEQTESNLQSLQEAEETTRDVSGEDDATPASVLQQEPERRITLREEQEQTVLELPISKDVKVDTEHQGNRLHLHLDPSIETPLARPSLAGTGIEEIDYQYSDDGRSIRDITFHLNEHNDYDISRQGEHILHLALPAPGSEQGMQEPQASDTPQEPEETELEQAEPPSHLLEDVSFYQTETGGMKIVLSGEEAPNYRLQPSEEEDELRISLPGTRIPEPQTKLYNLEQFETPVTEALFSNTKTGGQINLSMERRIPFNIDREENDLILSVEAEEYEPLDESEFKVEEESPEDVQPDLTAQPTLPGEEMPSEELESAMPEAEAAMPTEAGDLSDGIVMPGTQESYTGELVSIDVQDAELSHVFRLLSEVGDFNLVMDEGVEGTITLKLDEVPWDQALALILQQKELGMAREGNIIRIAPIDQLRQEQERIIEARKSALEARRSREELEPLHTEYIRINYSDAGQLQGQVQNFLSERGEVSHDPRTNQLIVSDTRNTLEKIRSVVDNLDRAERQVVIEARIVYATDEFSERLGLQWGGGHHEGIDDTTQYGFYGTGPDPGTGPGDLEQTGYAVNLPSEGPATLGLGAFLSRVTDSSLSALDAQLQLGESEGQVNTISKPKVVTQNNEEAMVEQGIRIPYVTQTEAGDTETEFEEAVLQLTVTPQITPDDKLQMDVYVEDESPVRGPDEVEIETRSVDTKLIVDDQSTIVIGGVHEFIETTGESRVTGLADLPVLGHLFQSQFQEQESRELLVFIRPQIL